MSRSAFVTGAYGLLGSWLVKALLERGAPVTVLRRDTVAVSALALEGTEQSVNVVAGDICDGELIERALGEYEVDSVFHLAAQTIVGVANRSPVSTFEANIRGTWTCWRRVAVLAWAASSWRRPTRRTGPTTSCHIARSSRCSRSTPTTSSKAATDMIARSYWHTFELPVAVTRLANIYGGGDLNLSRLVPECVLAAIAGRAPVIRSDGTLERDYLYVEDAVDAYLAIWELLEDGRGAGEAFNAGGDRPHSVLEVANLVCRIAGTGVEPDVRGTGALPGEIDRQWVDSAKLRSMSGWEPRASLEVGLSRTVDWYRDYLPQLGVGAGG